MRKIKFKDFQLELIEALKSFEKKFREENIFWWANSGTLLGAVRDGEIINWDDDVDMSMFNVDFFENENKISEIANSLNFELISPTDYYGLDVARLFSNEYILVEYDGKEYMTKIYIDIMIAIPSMKASKFKSKRWEILNKFSSIYNGYYYILPSNIWYKGKIKNTRGLMNFMVFISRLIILPFTFWVPILQNKKIRRYKLSDEKFQMFYCYNNKRIVFVKDKNNFTKTKFHDFEINIPKNFEDELETWFGRDWKKLPLKEKQIPHNLLLTPYTGKEKYKIVPFLIK